NRRSSSSSRSSPDERTQSSTTCHIPGGTCALSPASKLKGVRYNRIFCPVNYNVGQFECKLRTPGSSASWPNFRDPAVNRCATAHYDGAFGHNICFEGAGKNRAYPLVAGIQRLGGPYQDARSSRNCDPPLAKPL